MNGRVKRPYQLRCRKKITRASGAIICCRMITGEIRGAWCVLRNLVTAFTGEVFFRAEAGPSNLWTLVYAVKLPYPVMALGHCLCDNVDFSLEFSSSVIDGIFTLVDFARYESVTAHAGTRPSTVV